MTFYLGSHMPHWLWRLDVPLFVSRTTLSRRRSLHRATVPSWCLDSGAFTEVVLRGGHRTPLDQYANEARRFRDEIGRMAWAAPQDWMCEPVALKATGKTLREHQRLTVENFCALVDLAPDVPWVPVLQGWEPADYSLCVRMYEECGVDLSEQIAVGVGSVCRRQRTPEGAGIIRALSVFDLKLHGFKTTGLTACEGLLESADSMAWSLEARYSAPLAGHTHKNCANCPEYALLWRTRLLGKLGQTGDNTT